MRARRSAFDGRVCRLLQRRALFVRHFPCARPFFRRRFVMAATPSLRFLSLTLPVLLAASACQRDPLDYSPDELQALLDDGELDLPDTPITACADRGGWRGRGGSGRKRRSVAPFQPTGPRWRRGGRGSGVGGSGGTRHRRRRQRRLCRQLVPAGRGGSSGRTAADSQNRSPSRPACGTSTTATSSAPTWKTTTSSGFTAFRTVRAACVPGVEGQGVSLPGAQDLVYVPDQPVVHLRARGDRGRLGEPAPRSAGCAPSSASATA